MTDILFIVEGYANAYLQTRAVLSRLTPDCSTRIHDTSAQDAIHKYRENGGYDLVVVSIQPVLMAPSEKAALSNREFVKLLSSGIPVVTVYDSEEGYELARSIFKSLPQQFTITTDQIKEPSIANVVCERVESWMQARQHSSNTLFETVTRPLFRAIKQTGTNIIYLAAPQQTPKAAPN